MTKTLCAAGILGWLAATGCAAAGDVEEEITPEGDVAVEVVEPQVLAEATADDVTVKILGEGKAMALSIVGPVEAAARFSPVVLSNTLPSEAFRLLTGAEAPTALLESERTLNVRRLPAVEQKPQEKDALDDWFRWNYCNFDAAGDYIHDSLTGEQWGGEQFDDYPNRRTTADLVALNKEHKVSHVTWSYHAAYARKGSLTSNVYWKMTWKNGVQTTGIVSQPITQGQVHFQYTFAGWEQECVRENWPIPAGPVECWYFPIDGTVIQGVRKLESGDAASACGAYWGYTFQYGWMIRKDRTCATPLKEPFYTDTPECPWVTQP